MPDVSVIIPARDAMATLSKTLGGLAAQSFEGDFEVIVVDDGSLDDTAAIAAAAPVVARVIRTGGRGPSAARNAGVGAAQAGRLAFIDADCVPVPGWLAAGVTALLELEYVQGMTVPDPGTRAGPLDRSLYVQTLSPLFESANLFVDRDLFERLGGFEPWLIPRAGKELGEDVWLGWRARRDGARIGFAPQALVHHAVLRRSIREYAGERRRLVFFPALAARIPELRRELFWRRWFYSPRSAAFDAALAAVAAAAVSRRTLPLVAALPYLRSVRAAGRGSGPRETARLAVASIAADCVGCAALVAGSVRYRSPLL